jgi:sugar lactone lactonase YvrE
MFLAGMLSGAQSYGQLVAAPERVTPAPLSVYASFPEQVTGVAVSKTGRVFVNFPFWSGQHTNSVVEVKPDHTMAPYPDALWNDHTRALSDPREHFVCVQSVYVDANDKLWVLDPAAPRMGAVVPHGAKLVCIDLASNLVQRVYRFDLTAAPAKSYLNDVRVDAVRQVAYISDSGIGAILVVDLNSGKVRRVLNQVPETLGNGLMIHIGGRNLRLANGYAFTVNCDGIALGPDNNTLYFEAPTNGNIYSVATADLRNESLSASALQKRVSFVANVGPTDGFATDPDGLIYVTSVEDHSVKRVDPSATPVTTVVLDDSRLVWPDSMAWSQDGWLYVTASQIPRMPRFNGGQNLAQLPYELFRAQPLTQQQPSVVTPNIP